MGVGMLPLSEPPLQREDRATARRLFDERAYLEARGHYNYMRRRSLARRLKALITGAPWALRRLSDLGDHPLCGAQRLPDVQHVPIARIVGTDNRAQDFDCGFAPLREYGCERWLDVAVARAQGRPLPPVELVQVGGEYYVVDGHHRISVAVAYGEDTIDAYVVTYAGATAVLAAELVPA